MGEPIRIVDLARDLIRLRGQDPSRVEFVYSGLRPGERLHETLFHTTETAERTNHAGILRAQPAAMSMDRDELIAFVDRLEAAARDGDDRAVRSLLREGRYLTTQRADVPVGSA
jgi:FlaA1/EpsC-like NDP-sugar epimerase